MPTLTERQCVPCQSNAPGLTQEEISLLKAEVPEWAVIERDGIPRLERVFEFPDFARALAFTNKVGQLAEQQGHHPALLTEWGRVTVTWWTHAIKGLHLNDFVMAAKSDAIQ